MPKLSRSVPTYRKHRASGQAVVTLGYRDFYLGPYGTKTSKNEYDRLVGEWLQQGRQLGRQHTGAASGNRELYVVELIVAYLHFANRYYRKNGRLTSEYPAIVYAMRFVKRLYGRKSVSAFGPIALQAVMQKMVEAGWARRTINKQASRIKRMFRWGVSQELISGSIPEALSCVSGLRKGRTDARETAAILPQGAAASVANSKTNVGGWSEGRAWLSSQSVVTRANFAAALAEGRVWHPAHAPDLWQVVRRHRPTEDLEEAVAWFSELLWSDPNRAAVAEIVSKSGIVSGERRLPTAIALLLARPESQLS